MKVQSQHLQMVDVGCEGLPETFTITVTPTAQVVEVEDIVLCNGAVSTEVVFTPVSNPVNAITGGSAGTDQQSILGQTLFNETNSPATLTYTVTPTSAEGCVGTPFTVTITVNPTGQVEPVSSQVVCNGDSTTVDFTTDNTAGTTTYQWSSDSDLGSGLSGSGNISFTAENLTTDLLVSTFTVIPTFTNGDVGCEGLPETFTITVNPAAQVDQMDSQILCNDEQTTLVLFTTENTDGTTTYSWTNDTPSIGLASSGNVDISPFNVVNNGTSTVTATIIVTPSFEGCDGPTETFTITVNPTADMNDSVDIVACDTEVTDIVEFTTNNIGGTTTYTWTNDTPGIGLVASGSGDLPSFTAINTGTEPIVAIVEVT